MATNEDTRQLGLPNIRSPIFVAKVFVYQSGIIMLEAAIQELINVGDVGAAIRAGFKVSTSYKGFLESFDSRDLPSC